MPAFESNFFRGSWQYTYTTPRGYVGGYEPRAPVKSGLMFLATCKAFGHSAIYDLTQGSVVFVCRQCPQQETVDRTALDHGPAAS
jgi:hypothetical protein